MVRKQRAGKRRKICYFTVNKITYIDYKETELLYSPLSDNSIASLFSAGGYPSKIAIALLKSASASSCFPR